MHVSGQTIVNSRAFKDGYVSIQDKSSMMVAHIMKLGRDDKVLDVCSAPGGKACHMAEILFQKGKLMLQIYIPIKLILLSIILKIKS